ncbi:MAG: DUF692 domain-containing protein [Bryobacter sp.]|nr:DUF692 domain-containing protein [Bryobacter sp.]
MPNLWNLPDLGFGVGLRTTHFPYLLSQQPPVDWFEILSENFLDTGGRPLYVLDQIAERYPIVMHGVSLSIGSTDPIDYDYLRKLKALAQRTRAHWVSDHLCWTGVSGINTHDLLPMPYTDESLAHVTARVRAVSEFLERPVILENPSSYLEFQQSTWTEWDFLATLARMADCGLLLDVNNVYVSSRNHGFDPHKYLDAIPCGRVVQIHLAGHTDYGTHILDTHSTRVVEEVWSLYAYATRRLGPISTLLEWDEDIPSFPEVHAEARKARHFRAEAAHAAA